MKKPSNIINNYQDTIFTEKGIIDFRKYYSRIKHNAESISKKTRCAICGEEASSFCNSHLIPRFVLERITFNGKLVIGKMVANYPFSDKEQGINNATTFKCICKQCDNEKFQDYENEQTYREEISSKILNQISIKNYLSSYSKQIVECEQYKMIIGENNRYSLIYQLDADYSLKAIKSELKGKKHYLIANIYLKYTVPLAFQGELCLLTGFDGETINEYVTGKSDYNPHVLHIAVFPLSFGTKILMFINDGDTKYRMFYKRFRSLSLEEQLYVINYIILLYKDDWALSPLFKDKLNDFDTTSWVKTTQLFNGLQIHTKDVVDNFRIKTSGGVHNFLMDCLK